MPSGKPVHGSHLQTKDVWYAVLAQENVELFMKSAQLFSLHKLATLVLFAVLMACGTDETDTSNGGTVVTEPEAPSTPEPTEPTEKTGVEYYYSYCRGCHGSEAAGTSDGPQLRFPKEDYARWVIRNGRLSAGRRMPQFTEDSLTETQLEEMFVWLSSFERPTTGAGLYAVFCQHCHGIEGTGGAVRKNIINDISTPSLVLDIIRRGAGGNDYLKRSDYMPARSEEELSDAEAQLILDHIRTLAGL